VPLFSGIDAVFYQVCNMDRSVGFYSDVLGLELARREGNDWAEFNAGGATLALSGELAVAPQKGGATVVLRAEDLDALSSKLDAAEASRGPVEDMGGARMLSFHDPDGNEIIAIQPVS
jgi:catechol 2,3-dioxygenase-like lactoylglutathione lyase family enzyme